jgi:hypothetical protein
LKLASFVAFRVLGVRQIGFVRRRSIRVVDVAHHAV